MHHRLKELYEAQQSPTIVFQDNLGTVMWTDTVQRLRKVKHVGVKYTSSGLRYNIRPWSSSTKSPQRIRPIPSPRYSIVFLSRPIGTRLGLPTDFIRSSDRGGVLKYESNVCRYRSYAIYTFVYYCPLEVCCPFILFPLPLRFCDA